MNLTSKRIFFSSILLFLTLQAFGQGFFIPGNKITIDNYSGVALCVTDMNGDYTDDVVSVNSFSEIRALLGGDPSDSLILTDPISLFGFSIWALCAGDVNNDGNNEVFACTNKTGIYVFSYDDGLHMEQNIPNSEIFSQGSNLVDINNDGWLDLFVGNDIGYSGTYMNDGSGNLLLTEDVIDFSTIPASDGSGNYGTVWTDFDLDGDIDLYIGKCRQGVQDTLDPRRINVLYENDGNGNFNETAKLHGLADHAQSWTGDFGDVDNDGDLDCFVTNHDAPQRLYINDGVGNFTKLSVEQAGFGYMGNPIQGQMDDFNNDGLLDILVTGSDDYLLINNGDNSFTQIDEVFGFHDAESLAISDFNDDGYLDVLAAYAKLYNDPSSIGDQIWLNPGGEMNYVKLNLEGTVSNRSAVGAVLKIYGQWGVQIRDVRAGEGYGITNSLQQHFGLGEHQMIDSLVISWPSGIIEKYNNLEVNRTYFLHENVCIIEKPVIEVDGDPVICGQDSIFLETFSPGEIIWSTGAHTPDIYASESGLYSVVTTTGLGCYTFSNNVNVKQNPPLNLIITEDPPITLCVHDPVIVSADGANSYLWSNGDTLSYTFFDEPVFASLYAEGYCGLEKDTTWFLPFYQVTPPLARHDTAQTGGIAILSAVGDSMLWFSDEFGLDYIGAFDSIIIDSLVKDSTCYVLNYEEFIEDAGHVGIPGHGGGSKYGADSYNGGLEFDVLTDMILNSISVETEFPGERLIQVLNSVDTIIAEKLVDIPEGISRLDLGFFIPPGEGYKMLCNKDKNLEVFGTRSPKLFRSNADVSYPYKIPSVTSITRSSGGLAYYYYFYDWEVSTFSACESELVPVYAILDTLNTNVNVKLGEIQLFPNPTSGEIIISTDEMDDVQRISIHDLRGRIIKQIEIITGSSKQQFQVYDLQPGIYIARVDSSARVWYKRFLVQ